MFLVDVSGDKWLWCVEHFGFNDAQPEVEIDRRWEMKALPTVIHSARTEI